MVQESGVEEDVVKFKNSSPYFDGESYCVGDEDNKIVNERDGRKGRKRKSYKKVGVMSEYSNTDEWTFSLIQGLYKVDFVGHMIVSGLVN